MEVDAISHCDPHFLRRKSSLRLRSTTEPRLTKSLLLQLFLDLIYLPETYAPVLLSTKAMKLRKATNRWALHSKHEMNDFSITNFLENNLTRPLKMLVKEPMVLAITTFNAFTYGILCMRFLSMARTLTDEMDGHRSSVWRCSNHL